MSSRNPKITAEEVSEIVQRIHGTVLIIDTSTYMGTRHKAKFIDSEYGEHWMLPYTVIKGGSHPKRARKKGGISKRSSRVIVENSERFMICNHCSEKKEESLFHFNPSRKTYDGSCLDCWSKQKKENRIKNFESEKQSKKIYADHNREKVLETKRQWKLRNIGKVKADHTFAKERIKIATPKWLTKDQRKEIQNIYEEAYILAEKSGVSYHVDHILPLRGKNVSGLHVPWNLQILTAKENILKSNHVLNFEDAINGKN